MKPSAPVTNTVLGDIPLLKADDNLITNSSRNFTAISLIHGNQKLIYCAEIQYLGTMGRVMGTKATMYLSLDQRFVEYFELFGKNSTSAHHSQSL